MSLPPQYYFACLSLLYIVDLLNLVTVDENHIVEKPSICGLFKIIVLLSQWALLALG